MENHLLNETEAAAFLRVKPDTLRSWRSRKKGPPFIKLEGAVRYDCEKLAEYLKECSFN